MNVRHSVLAAVAAMGLCGADYPAMPPVYSPPPAAAAAYQPAIVGECESCGTPTSCTSCEKGKCTKCGHPFLNRQRTKTKGAYVTQLCPGACFGYFQTQWRPWQEVCPMPYQGVGLSDHPTPPSEYLPSAYDRQPPALKTPMDGTLPPPRPNTPKNGDPMPLPMGKGNQPKIPLPGGGN